VSYAYCSDTLFTESIIPYINQVDVLFHEATFTEELIERAGFTYHTTARQAGIIASKAKVKKLLIGHFSSRYTELNKFLTEAQAEFPETKLAVEGLRVDIH
jgi:ribonuclease Z